MSSATTKKERPCGRSLQRLVIGRGLVFRRLRDDGEGAGCRLECVRLAGKESRQRLLRSFATRPESAIRGDVPDRSPCARVSAMANQEPLGLRASSAFPVLAGCGGFGGGFDGAEGDGGGIFGGVFHDISNKTQRWVSCKRKVQKSRKPDNEVADRRVGENTETKKGNR